MSACRQRTASCIVIGCKTARRELTGWCDVGRRHRTMPPLTIITGETVARDSRFADARTIRAMSVRPHRQRSEERAMALRRERHQPMSQTVRPRLPRCGRGHMLIWTPFLCCLAGRKTNGRNDSAHLRHFVGYDDEWDTWLPVIVLK